MKTKEKEKSDILKGAFLSAITSFSKELFSENLTYIEGNTYTAIFSHDLIISLESKYEEPVIAYIICDVAKKRNIDKLIDKKIKPMLESLLTQFKQKYSGKNLIQTDIFDSFRQKLSSILAN